MLLVYRAALRAAALFQEPFEPMLDQGFSFVALKNSQWSESCVTLTYYPLHLFARRGEGEEEAEAVPPSSII
jgi:hypothetical protein